MKINRNASVPAQGHPHEGEMISAWLSKPLMANGIRPWRVRISPPENSSTTVHEPARRTGLYQTDQPGCRCPIGRRSAIVYRLFFAEKENLVKSGRGIFHPRQIPTAARMDGWSRAETCSGHDWCIVRLGAPGIVRGFDIDTNHFRQPSTTRFHRSLLSPLTSPGCRCSWIPPPWNGKRSYQVPASNRAVRILRLRSPTVGNVRQVAHLSRMAESPDSKCTGR